MLINAPGMFGFEEGWRSAYIVLGGVVLIVSLPIALLALRDYPSEKGLLPYGEGAGAGTAGKRMVSGVSKSDAVKSASFVWYAIMVISFTLCGAIMTFLPALASSLPEMSGLSGGIGSVGMFGAIIGGFLIGAINDRIGAQYGGLAAGALGAVGFLLMILGNADAWLLLGRAALYGIFYQINQVQMPAMVTTMYGEREYDKIFPVAAVFSPWVVPCPIRCGALFTMSQKAILLCFSSDLRSVY